MTSENIISCNVDDLLTESDVEQKLLWPVLTSPSPAGLAYTPAEIATKPDIRSLTIDKGDNAKLYYPDYVAMIAGIPFLIIEAKRPGENLSGALREARLYAIELNAKFPAEINPCSRLVVSNGKELISSSWDSDQPDCTLRFEQLNAANAGFAEFLKLNGREIAHSKIDSVRDKWTNRPFHMPLAILGGRSTRDEEVGHNTFGSTLALDYKHVFNPTTTDERAFIVKHAYVRSLRRDRYLDPIDRLIRAASPPSVTDAHLVEDTEHPAEILATLRRHKSLENQVLLLVGGVGSGKSTFVDYVREVAQSPESRSKTTWVRLDLNFAPLEEEEAYRWLMKQVTEGLRSSLPEIDFDDIEVIQKVFAVEVQRLRKGPLSVLDPTSTEYKTRWVDELLRLQGDALATAKATARFVSGERGKLLILVLDNCDKRTRDEQLRMFQISQWAQQEFNCLVFLPVRDVTYDHHRNQAPLNTTLKDLVFRIEPPQFAKVLRQRVKLALAEMARHPSSRVLSYVLPGGIRVEYPRSDQAMYLASILKSLYEYDRLIRRMITGLAGRDIRRAMELFLEFCTSGHIGEDEILKIRVSEGQYTLPLATVTRVLLRTNRRFYEGDKSYVKNLFQCNPEDPYPDNFVRLAILRWLQVAWREKGPTGIKGYHQIGKMVEDLVRIGHDFETLNREVLYLVQAKCILTEHQRTDAVSQDDLICLAPAGAVHLELTRNWDYLAACSEEVWYEQAAIAHEIARRIGDRGPSGHFTRQTALDNAKFMVDYLKKRNASQVAQPNAFLERHHGDLHDLTSASYAVMRARNEAGSDLYAGNLEWGIDDQDPDAEFSKHCEVLSAKVVRDTDTGRSRGFGFIRVAEDDVASIIDAVNGASIKGRKITIRRAT